MPDIRTKSVPATIRNDLLHGLLSYDLRQTRLKMMPWPHLSIGMPRTSYSNRDNLKISAKVLRCAMHSFLSSACCQFDTVYVVGACESSTTRLRYHEFGEQESGRCPIFAQSQCLPQFETISWMACYLMISDIWSPHDNQHKSCFQQEKWANTKHIQTCHKVC